MAATFIYARVPLQSDLAVKNTDVTAITQGQAVKIDASNLLSATQGHPGVVICTTDDVVDGVALEAIPVGGFGRIACAGVVRCTASAAITGGAQVQASTTGKVKTLVAAKPQVGKALEAAAADGDYVHVLLNGLGAKNA